MKTISDFIPGTTYVYLRRSWFKNEAKFDEIVGFLELPENTNAIAIDVNPRFYDEDEHKLYPANYGGDSDDGTA